MIMTKIVHYIIIIFSLVWCGVASAVTADEVTAKAIDRFGKSPSIKAVFKIYVHGHSATGNITVSGDRFYMDVDGMQTWYDGRTQWTYSPTTNEVSMTEPSVNELSQINPFAILSSLRKQFSAKLVKSTSSAHVVSYTPTSKGVNGRLTVTYSISTSWPTQVVVRNGSDDVTITVTSVTVGKTLHPSVFIYNKKLHPKAEIVDLR
jgi:outer membrane lipoprotein-sorting protein